MSTQSYTSIWERLIVQYFLRNYKKLLKHACHLLAVQQNWLCLVSKCTVSRLLCALTKKYMKSHVFSRQRDLNDTFQNLKILYPPPSLFTKPWKPCYKLWLVFLKYWLAAIETVINPSHISITTTLIQVHWDFITFTHLKCNFKDPGFTTVSDRI